MSATALPRHLPSIAARGLFPAVMGGALLVTGAALALGVPPSLSFVAPLIAAYVVVAVAETRFPEVPEWSRPRRDVPVDVAHFLGSDVITLEVLRPVLSFVAVAAAGPLTAAFGAGLWPRHWPLAAQLPVALLLGDFFMYWTHRLAHEVSLLWRFHAVHHSAPRLYFFNAHRFHPVDLVLSYGCWYVPLVALGAGSDLIALHTLFTAVNGIFKHTNFPLRLGRWNRVFSAAETHRWHHSPVLDEANANYGQNLMVWDVLFGTWLLPADRRPPVAVGLADASAASFPQDYLGQLRAPFSWPGFARGR
ncbi:MAG: sterol desaturase family protein [Deltaproteobacteria bacterium]|nr:sterol desaturase family protein [Deltaproteobacteria bacterium]